MIGGDSLRETAWTLDLDCATAEAVRILRSAGVPAILLKGPTLAALLYSDGAPRPYFDTDLLVPAEDLPAAGAALRAATYVPEHRLADAPAAAGYSEGFKRDWHLVELHVRFPETHVGPARTWAAVEPGARPLVLAGEQVQALGVGATALLLALHVAHHGHHGGGKPLEDLRRGIARLPEAAWREAAVLAQVLEAEVPFGWGLAQAPGGRELAVSLGIPVTASRRLLLRQRGSPRVGVGLDDLVAARGARERARVLRAKLLPSPLVMRQVYGAGDGRRALVRAHGRRWSFLVRAAPGGIAAFVSAIRAQEPGSARTMARSLRMGVRLGLASRADLHAIDERYYSGGRGGEHLDYASETHNRSGLRDWEEEALRAYFPVGGELVVVAAGGGREMLALVRAGHRVEGYECHPGLVAVANRLLAEEGSEAQVRLLERDRPPTTPRRYTGLIVGWGAYSLIQGEARRVAFLRGLRELAEPGAPVLVSFFARDTVALRYVVVRRTGELLRRLRLDDPVEDGDTLAPNFVHRFREADLRAELRAGGWDPVFCTLAGTAHAVALAR